MAGSFGAETVQGERYRLSFTVGGLLAQQGRILAEMYLKHIENSEAGRCRGKCAGGSYDFRK